MSERPSSSAPGPALLLASRSPRRAELLTQIGVAHALIDIEVDETAHEGERPYDYVLRLAREKARAGRTAAQAQRLSLPVLAADTTVVVDGRILGKPADAQEANAHLEALSGRTHEVMTGVALDSGSTQVRVSISEVTFRDISAAERAAYVATGEPLDKAGSYAVQGRGAIFVTRLVGSYSGVMGLPLAETAELLAAAGLSVLD